MVKHLSNILNELSELLADQQNPRSITYLFDKIAVRLKTENLLIETIICKEYYQDPELALILLMKNEALANAQFEQASKFRIMEKELLTEKGDSEMTRLKIEPHFFELRNNHVIFHCNKNLENQRLVANLIEGYNMAHANAVTKKMMIAD